MHSLSQRYLKCIRSQTEHIAFLSKFTVTPMSIFAPPSNRLWMEKPGGHLWLFPLPSFSTSNQSPNPANTTSQVCPRSSACPPSPMPLTYFRSESLAWNSFTLPKESSCISSLQSFCWYPDLIWSFPITAQSLEHSPLSKLTVSLEVRSLLKVYLNFFWPHRAACEILVFRPEIKPSPLADEVES